MYFCTTPCQSKSWISMLHFLCFSRNQFLCWPRYRWNWRSRKSFRYESKSSVFGTNDVIFDFPFSCQCYVKLLLIFQRKTSEFSWLRLKTLSNDFTKRFELFNEKAILIFGMIFFAFFKRFDLVFATNSKIETLWMIF